MRAAILKYYTQGKYTVDNMRLFVATKFITVEDFEKVVGISYKA